MPRPQRTKTEKRRVYLVTDRDTLQNSKAMAAKSGYTLSNWVLRLIVREVKERYRIETAKGYNPPEQPRDDAEKSHRVYLVFPGENILRHAKAMAQKNRSTFSAWVVKLMQKELSRNYQREMTLTAGYTPSEFIEPTERGRKT